MIIPAWPKPDKTYLSATAALEESSPKAFEFNPLAFSTAQTELGPDFRVARFSPGRFANMIQKNNLGRHALQVIREESTSSFILNLDPDGSATVCRGWRYLFFNDGPQVHTTEHIREQMGYRGGWASRDGWIQVDLLLDDRVCSRVGQYSQLIPNHAPKWHLRCLPVESIGQPAPATPFLVCQSTNVQPIFGEDEPHLVAGILPGLWLVLGAGNGLKIKIENNPDDQNSPAIQVESLPDPVRIDSWEQSF
jgi:hypothetical protein